MRQVNSLPARPSTAIIQNSSSPFCQEEQRNKDVLLFAFMACVFKRPLKITAQMFLWFVGSICVSIKVSHTITVMIGYWHFTLKEKVWLA